MNVNTFHAHATRMNIIENNLHYKIYHVDLDPQYLFSPKREYNPQI